jgi:hypothetical protein
MRALSKVHSIEIQNNNHVSILLQNNDRFFILVAKNNIVKNISRENRWHLLHESLKNQN